MASVLNQPFFEDENAAYTKLESIVWPNGATCSHCGSTDRMKKMGGSATRPGPASTSATLAASKAG